MLLQSLLDQIIMASVTIYRFRIDLTDTDRNVYEPLDFRAAQHTSETPVYLVTRVLAFIMNSQEGLVFSPEGLSNPDAPALRIDDAFSGGTQLWIEIGNPSARKLHKASKAAKTVKVYTYKNPELLIKEIKSNDVHRASDLEIVSFDNKFLERMAATLQKDNTWNVIITDGLLSITFLNSQTEQSQALVHPV